MSSSKQRSVPQARQLAREKQYASHMDTFKAQRKVCEGIVITKGAREKYWVIQQESNPNPLPEILVNTKYLYLDYAIAAIKRALDKAVDAGPKGG